MDCRKLAFDIVNQGALQKEKWQCLLVDLRGHGESDLDEYSAPHSLDAICDDVLECIMCYGLSPDVVIAAGGSLSKVVALKYLEKAVLGQGAPSSISYEVSGDMIRIPKTTVLMNCKESVSRNSFAILMSNLSFILKKSSNLLKDPVFSSVGNRAEFRKQLLISAGSKQGRAASKDLRESLKVNMDILHMENDELFRSLQLRHEADMELPNLLAISDILNNVASEIDIDGPLFQKLQEFVESHKEMTEVCLLNEGQTPLVFGKRDSNGEALSKCLHLINRAIK